MNTDEKMISISCYRPKSFSWDSKKIDVTPNKKYRFDTKVKGIKGIPYSAYFALILFDKYHNEINRFIKWINDFSSETKNYEIIFDATPATKTAMLGYRFNVETPVKGNLEFEINNNENFQLEQLTNNQENIFDNINEYVVPQFSSVSLTSEEQTNLAKKFVWMFSTIRSGSTWLGEKLLQHPSNYIWSEPWIGNHLDALGGPGFENGPINDKNYIFSPKYKQVWLPYLRKLILQRGFSEVRTFEKNIITKEPTAAGVAEIFEELFPESKIIFLVRDPRDVIDSVIDAHKENSWNKDLRGKELGNKAERLTALNDYSNRYNLFLNKINKLYEIHDQKSRLFVKYEDLKINTKEELRKIYDFLKIEISEQALQRKIDRYDFKKIPESQKGSGKVTRVATPGNWKNSFSVDEQFLMNSILNANLKKFGYK